jgi:hypothetical protein
MGGREEKRKEVKEVWGWRSIYPGISHGCGGGQTQGGVGWKRSRSTKKKQQGWVCAWQRQVASSPGGCSLDKTLLQTAACGLACHPGIGSTFAQLLASALAFALTLHSIVNWCARQHAWHVPGILALSRRCWQLPEGTKPCSTSRPLSKLARRCLRFPWPFDSLERDWSTWLPTQRMNTSVVASAALCRSIRWGT